MPDERKYEEVIAWARYLAWADQHRKRLADFFEQEPDSDSPGHTGRFITHTSQWFASLWVAVEGYKELGLRDNFVDAILENPPNYADLLRRCRNGVYHYQPELLAPRLGEFLTSAQAALAWVHALHSELIRVFWHFPERWGVRDALADDVRDRIGEILGWLPDEDSIYVTLSLLERRVREYSVVVPRDDDSPEAAEVRDSIQQLRCAIDELRKRLLKEQQRYRDSGWLGAILDGEV
jgi:hypothetical protein